jgi:hypothetical protein
MIVKRLPVLPADAKAAILVVTMTLFPIETPELVSER